MPHKPGHFVILSLLALFPLAVPGLEARATGYGAWNQPDESTRFHEGRNKPDDTGKGTKPPPDGEHDSDCEDGQDKPKAPPPPPPAPKPPKPDQPPPGSGGCSIN